MKKILISIIFIFSLTTTCAEKDTMVNSKYESSELDEDEEFYNGRIGRLLFKPVDESIPTHLRGSREPTCCGALVGIIFWMILVHMWKQIPQCTCQSTLP